MGIGPNAAPVGYIPVVVTGDLSQLEAALSKAQQIAAAGGSSIGTALSNGLKQAAVSADQVTASVGNTTGAITSATPAVAGMNAVIRDTSQASAGTTASLKTLDQGIRGLTDGVKAQTEAMSKLPDQLKNVKEQASGAGSSMRGFLSSLGIGIPGSIAAGIALVGVSAIKLSGDLEQATVAFTRMMGSADAAKAHLAELQQFAANTPFQFTQLVDASRKLQALGFSATQVIPMLRTLGDAASGLKLGEEGINRLIKALGDMQNKGRVMTQEMNQLTEAGVNGWKYLAEQAGVSVAQMRDMVEKGAMDGAEGVQTILAGLQKQFGGMMAEGVKTIPGQWSNVIDKLKIQLTELGDAFKPLTEDGIKDLNRLLSIFEKMVGAVGAVVSGVNDLSQKIEKLSGIKIPALDLLAATATMGNSMVLPVLEGIAKKLGIVSDQVKTTTTELKNNGNEWARLFGVQSQLSSGAKKIIEDQQTANRAYADAVKVYNELVEARKRGEATDAAVARAAAAVKTALDDLGETTKKTKMAHRELIDVFPELGARLAVLRQEYNKLAKDHAELVLALERGKVGFLSLEEGIEGVTQTTADTAEEIKKLKNLLPDVVTDFEMLTAEAKALQQAYKDLGLSSERDLNRLKASLDRVLNDPRASDSTKTAAIVSYWRAQLEEAEKAGETIPRAQLIMLKRMEEQLQRSTARQLGFWEDLRDNVIGTLDDLAGDIARGAVDVVRDLFTDDTNKQLDQQARDLRESLAERAADLDKFEQETIRKIEEVTAAYDKSLDEEVAALNKSLADRKAEYEKYQAQVSKQLQEITTRNRDELNKAVQAVRDRLRDQEREFERYSEEVARSEQRIRQESARELDGALDDLRRNLAERKTEYDKFVRDASETLDKIGRDFYRELEDLNRASNRRLQDENISYNRDTIALNEELRQAEADGDMERSASLRRELSQRAQDHQITLQRISEDEQAQTSELQQQTADRRSEISKQLAEAREEYDKFTEDVLKQQREISEESQRQLRAQLEDLSRGLAEQTAEMGRAREAAEKQISDLTAKYNADLAKQRDALTENLGERKKALDEYQQEISAQIDAVTKRNREALAEEVAQLTAALDLRRKEYQAFKEDVFRQLAEIEAQHKSVLDRIGEMFRDVFAAAGAAIAEFVTKYLVGMLISKLTDALGLTEKLGRAVNAATGIGERVAGEVIETGETAAKTATKIGSGIGSGGGGGSTSMGSQAASGLTGMVNMITGVGQLISSIVGNFQMARLEGTSNQIERNTAAISIHALHILEKLNEYLPNLELLHQFNQGFWTGNIAYIETLLEGLQPQALAEAFNPGRTPLLPAAAVPESIGEALRSGGGMAVATITNYNNITSVVQSEADMNTLASKLSAAIGKGGQV